MNYRAIKISLCLLPILLFFLFADLTIFTIFGHNISALLLCAYIITLLFGNNILSILLAAFFVSLEFFALYGNVFILISYLVPLSVLAHRAKITIRKESVIPYLLLALLIMIEQLLVVPCLFGVKALGAYTFYKICGNILMLVIFLKFLPKGKQGDRL